MIGLAVIETVLSSSPVPYPCRSRSATAFSDDLPPRCRLAAEAPRLARLLGHRARRPHPTGDRVQPPL